jgi:hypothetical protein
MTAAHRLIMCWCVAKANAMFEELCVVNNDFYALSKNPDAKMDRQSYVNRVAPTLIDEARQELAKELHHDNHRLTADQKEVIAEALLLDTQIPSWRNRSGIPVRYLKDGTLRAMHKGN